MTTSTMNSLKPTITLFTRVNSQVPSIDRIVSAATISTAGRLNTPVTNVPCARITASLVGPATAPES